MSGFLSEWIARYGFIGLCLVGFAASVMVISLFRPSTFWSPFAADNLLQMPKLKQSRFFLVFRLWVILVLIDLFLFLVRSSEHDPLALPGLLAWGACFYWSFPRSYPCGTMEVMLGKYVSILSASYLGAALVLTFLLLSSLLVPNWTAFFAGVSAGYFLPAAGVVSVVAFSILKRRIWKHSEAV